MRKGISPIVAIVMLIAISVIAAVGLYYWVGGLATKQPTPDAPLVIAAQTLNCTTSTTGEQFNVSVLVMNLDPTQDLDDILNLIADNGTCQNESAVSITANQQAEVTFDCDSVGYTVTRGNSYTIYAESSSAAMITC